VEVATFGKILGHFSPIVPPSASIASDAFLWRKVERSKSLVLLQVGVLTCRWQRHSVQPSCCECSTTVEQAETQLRVVVPIEEEEEEEEEEKEEEEFRLMTNLTHSFSMYLFHAFTCFEQQVLIIRRTNLCQYIIWYNTLWWVTVRRVGQDFPPDRHVRQVTHHIVLYQMMY
jgi:hypothetical protein